MSRADAHRVAGMVMAADEIAAIVARGRAAFDDDVVLRRPIERCLEIMGEASQTVSREFVAAHVEIPWSDMAKVRDRLSHHYQVIEIAHDGFSGVLIDHFAGGVQVGRYLTARGHRRLAYLGHRQDHDYQSQSRQKLAGFSSVLDEAPLVREIDNDFAHAVNAALELFDSPDRDPRPRRLARRRSASCRSDGRAQRAGGRRRHRVQRHGPRRATWSHDRSPAVRGVW